MAKKTLPAIVWQEGKWFVAKTIGLEVASQGKTKNQALKNLEEAVELYFEDEGVDFSTFTPTNIELLHIHA